MISFEVKGGADAATRALNRFEVFRLAVSLGGTDSLVEHPMSMTHADVPREELEANGVTEGLIRMSVGLEHLSDLSGTWSTLLICRSCRFQFLVLRVSHLVIGRTVSRGLAGSDDEAWGRDTVLSVGAGSAIVEP